MRALWCSSNKLYTTYKKVFVGVNNKTVADNQTKNVFTLVEEIRRGPGIERVRELLDPETMDAALGDGDKVVFTMCIFFIVVPDIGTLHVSHLCRLCNFFIQLFLMWKTSWNKYTFLLVNLMEHVYVKF